ncbi:hypothetical protein RT717_22540 [Imperialibacter roseus]|uniref:Uncharacterized protein n=1 Tax=Imperialibacter roseus TaxID=1324217 RepID=A0ABZ0IQJ8_9BACT|nr:hypothetical protein [Imperialibacter roseus]WOK05857.1 hypothetical protein RT717_22540 [Imperialibacter roseus]
MAQYVFFMILSLGLYFSAPKTTTSHVSKKAKKSLHIIKTDGGDDTWGGGGK